MPQVGYLVLLRPKLQRTVCLPKDPWHPLGSRCPQFRAVLEEVDLILVRGTTKRVGCRVVEVVTL